MFTPPQVQEKVIQEKAAQFAIFEVSFSFKGKEKLLMFLHWEFFFGGNGHKKSPIVATIGLCRQI